MKHARFRRSAALLSAAAVAVGGLVAINAASSSAAVPSSGDRIVHWDVNNPAPDPPEQVRLPDIAAPEGQRFTEVFPDNATSTVVALTNRDRVVVSGDAYPELPEGVLDGPVRDVASDGNTVGVVTQSGDVVAWSRSGVRDVPDGLCAADQAGVDGFYVVVVCEDGSVEARRWDASEPVLQAPDALSDVQQLLLVGGVEAIALTGDGSVHRWSIYTGATSSEEVPETAGKDIAAISADHAITADGGLISYGRHPHYLPADEGGVDPTVVAEGVTSLSSLPGSAFLTTREGTYASWGTSTTALERARRTLPETLQGLRFVEVGAAGSHVALIVADTDPPPGPQLVTESAVEGADDDGTTVPGTSLTGVPATFEPAADEVTTDWLVDGEVVEGATGETTFDVTSAMIGQQISFRTRATSSELAEPLDSVTDPITVLAPEGRRVVTPSSVTGAPAAGRWLVGVPAEYDSPPTSVSTRWYLDGEEILDARNTTDLLLADEMVGQEVTFETRATWSADQGALPAITSRSAPVEVRVALAVVKEAVIEGEPVVGSELRVVSRAEFSDTADDVTVEGQWLRDFWEPVGTGETYTLTSDDIGHTIVWNETATRFADEPQAFSFSNAISDITAAPLVINGSPVITGSPYIGEELTVQPAPFNDDAADVTYQWRVGGEPAGDGGTTFAVLEEHAGQTITVEQIVSRGGATEPGADYASAESEPTGPVTERPADLAVETEAGLSGTPLVGQTLTGTPAVFSPTENVTVTNYWVIGGVEVEADGTTLTLTDEHVGQNIQFKSVATRNEDSLESTSSTVGPVLAVLEVTAPPTISGTPEVGQTLTANPATFSTTDGVTVTNRWLANGSPIDGATGLTLELTEDHLGDVISFESVATRGDDTVRAESDATAAVSREAIEVTSAPTISGTPEVGQTLTGTPAVFSITEGVTVTNRWLADGEPIDGATGTSLELTDDHQNRVITFESSAVRGEEAPVVSVSEPVGPVRGDDNPPTGTVEILLDGPTAPGATITVQVGTDLAGQQVQVYLSNLERLLPAATVAADGTIQVLVPGDIPLGTHRLAVYADGELVDWDDFTVTLVRPEDPAFQDQITVEPNTVEAGEEVTVTVGAEHAGQQVRVVLFSTPRDLGFATVAEDGTLRVTIPADTTAGVHRLAVYDAAGALIGWQDITVTGGPDTGGRSGTLPDAGADVPGVMVPLGLVLLLAGAGLVAFRARGGRHQLG